MTSKALRLSGLAKELDALAAASSSTLVVYEFTATANQTVFGGVDNNGLTLNYIGPNALVLYNEGMLQKTVDYVTTSSSVLTLTLGAEVGALVRVYAFGTFAVANVYTKPESDVIITNLALKSASKADILGTVSQTAGVPTGALTQNYIDGVTGQRVSKQADGTCVVTGFLPYAAVGSNANKTWSISFPAGLFGTYANGDVDNLVFSGTPVVSNDVNTVGFVFAQFVSTANVLTCTLIFRNGATAQNVKAAYRVEGRWF